jgi:hypothetical protein
VRDEQRLRDQRVGLGDLQTHMPAQRAEITGVGAVFQGVAVAGWCAARAAAAFAGHRYI